ncbi:MAG: hypothetical protein JW836_07980 [Deltaproteobacteria bacterium]|nr:hypothetical protein [Deltaproteobacteria bacterium]
MTFMRFEMHHYTHVFSRMRLGETDRAIARAGLMGRRKIAHFRQVALKQGRLESIIGRGSLNSGNGSVKRFLKQCHTSISFSAYPRSSCGIFCATEVCCPA